MLQKNGARGREGKTSPVHTQAASARRNPQEEEMQGDTAVAYEPESSERTDVKRPGVEALFLPSSCPLFCPPGSPGPLVAQGTSSSVETPE